MRGKTQIIVGAKIEYFVVSGGGRSATSGDADGRRLLGGDDALRLPRPRLADLLQLGVQNAFHPRSGSGGGGGGGDGGGGALAADRGESWETAIVVVVVAVATLRSGNEESAEFR